MNSLHALTLAALYLLVSLPPLRAADPTPSATDPSTASPGSWVSLFDGKTLTGWKVAPEEDLGQSGQIQVKDEALEIEVGTPFSALIREGKFPKDNYEVELDAKRRKGNDIFCGLYFPVGADAVTMVLGGWSNCIVGLSCVDSLAASDNETGASMSFKNDQWYHVRLRVDTDHITAWIDGKKMIDIGRIGHRFSPYPGLEVLKPFGLFTWDSAGSLRKLRVRRLPGK